MVFNIIRVSGFDITQALLVDLCLIFHLPEHYCVNHAANDASREDDLYETPDVGETTLTAQSRRRKPLVLDDYVACALREYSAT